MELTIVQKEILLTLINLFREKKRAIKGEEIAEVIDRNPGTIRNQMQSLKALKLVEGVPGPKGGYIATGRAFEALGVEDLKEEALVLIRKGGEIMEGVTVDEIDFTSVRHPDLCQAKIRLLGDIRKFNIGDTIQIGPTPVNKLVIRGEIAGRDDVDNLIICNINEMISLPKRAVKEFIARNLITIDADAQIREAARILVSNNIHGAPVTESGKIVGIITFTDLGGALAAGKISAKVREIMSTNVIAIDGNTPFYEAVKIMDEHKIGRLVITENEKPIGMITRTDVLSKVAVI